VRGDPSGAALLLGLQAGLRGDPHVRLVRRSLVPDASRRLDRGRQVPRRAHPAVEANLEKKGYRKARGAEADILVAYHTGQSGVASQDEYGVYNWWWFPVYVYQGSDYEKERTLVIDVRDARRRLVWRGAIQRLEGTNPEAVAREIDRTVADLLSRFPPAPGAVPPSKP
jgi:hypothetical protein